MTFILLPRGALVGAPSAQGREAMCLTGGVTTCPASHVLTYRLAKQDAILDLI